MAQVVTTKCAVCGENKSKLLCYECNQELCEICQPLHDKFSGNKQHTIVDNREMTWLNYAEKLKCKTHDQENRYICSTCSSFICAECIIEEHKSHDVKSIKKISCDYRIDLSKTELKVKGKVEMLFDLKTKIQKKKKTLQDNFDLLERDLQSCIHDVQNIVQDVADAYIATTTKHLIKQENIGDSELRQVEMTEIGYKTFTKTLSDLEKEKHDGSFVTQFMWLQGDMENLMEMPSVKSDEGFKSFDRTAFLSTITDEITSRAEGLKDLQKSKELKDMLKLKEEEVIKSNHTCEAVLKELDVLHEHQIKMENENIILKYEYVRIQRLLEKPENVTKQKYRQLKADYRKLKTDKDELQKRQ